MIAGLQGVLPGMEVVGSESCAREADALPQLGLCLTLDLDMSHMYSLCDVVVPFDAFSD